MKRLAAATRIALCMSILSTSALLLAKAAGLVPDHRSAVVQGRIALSETLAINSSALASRGDYKQLEAMLRAVAHRTPDITSVGVRLADGKLLIEVGPHSENWHDLPGGASTETQILVPIRSGNELWGTMELGYKPATLPSSLGLFDHPLVELVFFIGIVNVAVFYIFLRRVLKHLDPSKVVPERVRSALNALVSGLLLLDKNRQIVLANEAFAATLGVSPESLQGQDASTLPWQSATPDEGVSEFPWERSLRQSTPLLDQALALQVPGEARRIFQVNASPIVDEDGTLRGALASFDDVTALEYKKEELLTMLEALKTSREAIREQNEKLQILATRDPLTGCLNRRSFFEEFQGVWQHAASTETPLSCVMVDVDYFKSVNDNYGHSAGDEVLRQVGRALWSEGKGSLVCRFGGEEFCVAMRDVDLDDAAELAEKIRESIARLEFDGFTVTASLGASSNRLGAATPQELLDQADKCLYAAKRKGRNQVIRWDRVPADLEVDASKVSRIKETDAIGDDEGTDGSVVLPYHAVTGLISALAYRDVETAMHSMRVAELCQRTAQGLLSIREQYVLEIAAMLHDIGKVGVPDSILLKPGPLTEAEWQTMAVHDQVGVEIVNAAFGCPQLTRIVQSHHAHFGGNPKKPGSPRGQEIPLAARILSIADAYDAMISDRVYRKGRSPEEAFEELRRCSPKQFDPEMVERFIEVQRSALDQQPLVAQRAEKQAALQIGLQLERLAQAVDDQDLSAVGLLASRLSATAARHRLDDLSRTAAELCKLAEGEQGEDDLKALITTTHELLTLASHARQSYVDLNPTVVARTPQGKDRYFLATTASA